jgi:hypothetical protein
MLKILMCSDYRNNGKREIVPSLRGHLAEAKKSLRYCKRSEAIQVFKVYFGLPRRFAPRNDGKLDPAIKRALLCK